MENLNKRPSKGILRFSESSRSNSVEKDIKWDEANIKETLHPDDKDYGFMKIDEPPTPYSRSPHGQSCENSDEEDLQSKTNELLERVSKKIKEPPVTIENVEGLLDESDLDAIEKHSDVDEEMVPEIGASDQSVADILAASTSHSLSCSNTTDYEPSRASGSSSASDFELKRKRHYNEYYAVKLAKKLMEKEVDDDEEEEDDDDQREEAKLDDGDGGGTARRAKNIVFIGGIIADSEPTTIESNQRILINKRRQQQAQEISKRRIAIKDQANKLISQKSRNDGDNSKQEETEAIIRMKKQNLLYLLTTPPIESVKSPSKKRRIMKRNRQSSSCWLTNFHHQPLAISRPMKLLTTTTMILLATCQILAVLCATSGTSSTAASTQQQVFRSSQNADSVFGCPYPGVGANCQVNIIAQAPAVPLLSTEYVADEYATLKPDTQASYKCDQGYELLGQETLICLASGRWSAPPPSCVTNIAIGKPTNQSSTVKGGDSRNANDGRLTTQHDSKHCTETRVDQSPWWQIDLLQLYEIRSVRLLGRACCNPQLSLHDIEIRVGNSSTLQGNRLCAWYPNNLDEGVARDFQCAHPIVGRFVSIQMVGIESALSLCEVMIFSTKEFPVERCNVQATLAPSNNKPQPTTTTSATTTSQNNNPNGVVDNQLIVFNRTCYEMQTSNGGSFLVADTYCKARGGSLLHSVDNLTQNFIAQELERMKSKLKSKLVWLGAKRETTSPNSLGPITPGSTSALIGLEQPVAMNHASGRSLTASLDEFPAESLFSSSLSSGESSPIFSPLTMSRASLYQVSSGAGGSTSRGSQTFGLPTTGAQQHSSNRTVEHPQRSLIISQPSQVASFFTPPVTVPSSIAKEPVLSVPQSPAPANPAPAASSPISFSTPHIHRSLRPPALVSSSTSSPASVVASSSSQSNWAQSSSAVAASSSQPSSSSWRWVGDAASESLLSPISTFLWADDQPNNYNNQQDCIVLDGGKKWLWNDVTCELDYLPWVCQYRPSTCGSPDRHENSTILELTSSQDGATNSATIPYQLGKTITYACPVGHRLDGPKSRKCQYDGTWSGKAPKCQYVNCGPISSQSIENGRIVYLNQSQTTFGSQVKYVCYEDYVLVGSDLRQCQGDGKWDGKAPYCAYKWCPVLQQIPNGFMNVSSYSENSIASYQCNSGYKLIGNDTRQCLLGGKWTNQEPFCQYVDCGQPKQIANGNYLLVNSTTNYLSVVAYSCNENYTLVGNNNKMICSHNNRWTGKEPQCTLIDCGQPQANSGSSFSGDSFSIHSTVEYKCDPGFKEVSGSTQRTCGSDGRWTGQPISCKYVDCGRVPGILKGEVSYINGTTYLASQVAYECTPGNRLSGHRIRFCGPDGRWTGTSPKCEEVRCDAPNLPTNGSAIYIGNDRSFKEQSFSVGVTVQYECDYGHVVKGSWASRLCQANGEWSGEAPVCKFVDCGSPPTIENGNYVLKHPPAGSVGSATPVESTRRSDTSGSSSGQTGSFTYYGTIAHYNCDPNYKMQGPSQRECLDSGQWRTPLPTCEPVQCPKPEHFDEFTQVSLVTRANSQSVESSHSSQSAASTTGDHQSLVNLAKSIRLISNNQWINHDVSVQQFGVGDKLYYSCVPGYELYGGPEIRTCTQYGQWSGSSTPRCRLIDCGRPAPIGQEGRFYLLNETTTFNSIVEYSCVRPFKLVEIKIRQAGNLIETLNTAQAGVTPILTSLPIGVKVCANNGQWMPNDQQPKCVSATDPSTNGQYDGVDNTLDGSSRVQVLAGPGTGGIGGSGSGNNNQLNDGGGDNNLDAASGRHQSQPAGTSLWAQVIIAICLLVMLALIILTLICIRSGKKPKQTHHHHRTSILTANGHPSVAAAAAAAMQIQLANGVNNNSKSLQQQAVVAAQQAAAAGMMSANQNIYLNGAGGGGGAHKMFSNSSMVQQNQLAGAHMSHQLNHLTQAMPYGDAGATLNHSQGLMLAASITGGRPMVGGDIMMNGKSSSLGIMAGDNNRQNRNSQAIELPMSASSVNVMDTYSRLSIESDTNDGRLQHQQQMQQATKTIRHNPNGLVTFVSPAQQQHNRNSVIVGGQQQQQSGNLQGATSQNQVSPQSISTSLSVSSSSSPSSSSSAHHTTATRLSTTDSASSSSSASNANNRHTNNNGYQTAQPVYNSSPLQQPSPPSLPAHPPPPHRLQQHTKQLMKQQQQLQQQQQPSMTGRQTQQQSQAGRSLMEPSSQQQQKAAAATGNNHHYMEPTI